jgi:flavorubredoxin
MLDTTEIADGIFRISMWDEKDLIEAGIFWPGVSYNLFVVRDQKSAIVQTMYRKTFARLRERVAQVVDPAELSYIVVPHHEGDSSGAVNEWAGVAAKATILCSELCASLNLRDFSDRAPRVVSDGEVVDLGARRLRFLMTPQVNQWDSLMIYEETTRTLFPNDLFSQPGIATTTRDDPTRSALESARELGYQPNDRTSLLRALDKIAPLQVDVIANMHGPAVYGHFGALVRAFRENDIAASK